MPNIVSTQQFPQEMEFTENVSTIPMKRLVFKEGGVLKGEYGIPSGLLDFTKKLNLTSNLGTTVDENGAIKPNLDIAGMARRSSLTTPAEYKPVGVQTVSTNYSVDHAYGSGNETKATKQVGDY
jgi:hypothetical protein